MYHQYIDPYQQQLARTRIWQLASACLAVALAIACMQWGRAWVRAVRAEGSATRTIRLEFGRRPDAQSEAFVDQLNARLDRREEAK